MSRYEGPAGRRRSSRGRHMERERDRRRESRERQTEREPVFVSAIEAVIKESTESSNVSLPAIEFNSWPRTSDCDRTGRMQSQDTREAPPGLSALERFSLMLPALLYLISVCKRVNPCSEWTEILYLLFIRHAGNGGQGRAREWRAISRAAKGSLSRTARERERVGAGRWVGAWGGERGKDTAAE